MMVIGRRFGRLFCDFAGLLFVIVIWLAYLQFRQDANIFQAKENLSAALIVWKMGQMGLVTTV